MTVSPMVVWFGLARFQEDHHQLRQTATPDNSDVMVYSSGTINGSVLFSVVGYLRKNVLLFRKFNDSCYRNGQIHVRATMSSKMLF